MASVEFRCTFAGRGFSGLLLHALVEGVVGVDAKDAGGTADLG